MTQLGPTQDDDLNPFQCVSESYRVYTQNFLPLFLAAVMLLIPVEVLMSFSEPPQREAMTVDNWFIAAGIVSIFVNSLLSATIICGTFQALSGRQVNIGECLSYGLSVLFPVSLIHVMFYTAMGVGLAVVMLIGTALGGAFIVVGGAFVVGVGLVLTMFYAAIQTVVIERQSVFAALARSRFLTHGYRWRIFNILCMTLLMLVLLVSAGQALGSMISAAGGSLLVTLFVYLPINALGTALFIVIGAVVYYRLRVLKENYRFDDGNASGPDNDLIESSGSE